MGKYLYVSNLTPLHWVLAFAGAAIYLLMKIQQNSNKGFNVYGYFSKYWASSIATVIMIPVVLFILSENFADVLPINNLTAVLAGYQTNSIFKNIMSLGRKKYTNNQETETKENES